MIPVSEPKSFAEMQAAHKARQYRMFTKPTIIKRRIEADRRRREDEQRQAEARALEERKNRECEALERIAAKYREIFTPNHPDGRQRVENIIREVAKKRGFTAEDIKGACRNKILVAARHEAILEVKMKRPELSLPAIGMAFGNRDHTTILHALRKMGYYDRKQERAA